MTKKQVERTSFPPWVVRWASHEFGLIHSTELGLLHQWRLTLGRNHDYLTTPLYTANRLSVTAEYHSGAPNMRRPSHVNMVAADVLASNGRQAPAAIMQNSQYHLQDAAFTF